MNYKQSIAFNQSRAGKKPGFCEQNVRLGFGIDSKYGSAWENWQNTAQHTEAIPVGVDVPVFFSYEGPDNGHVGVQLASGKFWSDGSTYDSIAAFETNHTPRYVGWSDSVDGVPVIHQPTTNGGKAVITKEDENAMSILATGSYPGKDYNYQFTGTSNLDAMINFWLAESKSAGLLSK